MKKHLLWGTGSFLSFLALLASASGQVVTNVVTNATLAHFEAVVSAARTNGGYVYFNVDGTFPLTSTLVVTNPMTFDGGTNQVTISGNNQVRVFSVTDQGQLILNNLNVANGRSATGAGLYNDGGVVTIYNCFFLGNRATNSTGVNGANGDTDNYNGGNGTDGGTARGGAIYSRGDLYIKYSVFATNGAYAGDGGDGGTGQPDYTFGGKGGNGGNGGNAYGGAIFIAGGTNRILATQFQANDCWAGNGGTLGLGGSAAFPGDSGKGGIGGAALGAAVCNSGAVWVMDCTFLDNGAFAGGTAGVQAYSNGRDRNADNGGAAYGGGIYNSSRLLIQNATFHNNYCSGGAGGNAVNGLNSKAGNGGNAGGGAIANVGTGSLVGMRNCTLATNNVEGGTNGISSVTANNGILGQSLGGNLYNSGGSLLVSNTILAKGLSGANCWGGITDGGYNISSDGSCKFSKTGSHNNLAPMLDTVRSGTLAMVPLPGSPAIGVLGTDVYYPPGDQNGTPRPQGKKADIGAVEVTADSLVPTIATQPRSWTVRVGDDVMLMVGASGQGPLYYQWRVDGLAIQSGTNSSLVIQSARGTDSGTYVVTVSNEYGAITSSNATLQVLEPVKLVTQPQSMAVTAGTTATFSVSATGAQPLGYQWYFKGAAISGSTNASLAISNVQSADAGNYSVQVTNAVSSVTSTNAQLKVSVPPAIVSQPTDKKLQIGVKASLTMTVQGDSPLSYQWFWNDAPVGGNSNTLEFAKAQLTNNGLYVLVVSNAFGMATSAPVVLTVCRAVTVSVFPQGATNVAGQDVTFSATIDGTDPITCQWSFNGFDLIGATNTTLSLTNVQASQAGSYSVRVIDAVSQKSAGASLFVNVPATITRQPQSQSIVKGHGTTLQVTAIGDPMLAYQWTCNGTNLDGATNASLTIAAQTNATASYAVIVTNSYGVAISSNAVISAYDPVVITSQPQASQSVAAGTNISMAVGCGDMGPFRYQWYLNNKAVAGATNAELILTNLQPKNSGTYKVAVSNPVSTTNSSGANVTVLLPVTIVTSPKSRTNIYGAAITLTVGAKGDGKLSYQWSKNGQPIPGAKGASYALSKVTDNAVYSVLISNSVSACTTQANVTVIPPAPAITSVVRTNDTLVVKGTASAAANATNVAVSVNGTPLADSVPAINGKWSCAISPMSSLLEPGVNTLSAVARAPYGDSLSVSRNYTLIQSNLLSVEILGNGTNDPKAGTLSPNLNGKLLIVGKNYTMTAKPAAGKLFAGWSGGVSSSAPALTFSMQPELALTANFIDDPFAANKGNYSGLFFDPANVDAGKAGALALSLSEKGVFSGKIRRGTNSYSISGQFNASGDAILTGSGRLFNLSLQMDALTNRLEGIVSGTGWSAPFVALKSPSSAGVPAGKYTLTLPGFEDQGVAVGDGVASLTVDSAGSASISGYLADGTSFAGVTPMCAGDQWPVFIPLYGGQGVLLGWLEASNNVVAGSLSWAAPGGMALFPSGFAGTTTLVSSPFQSSRVPLIDLPSATLSLSGGNLDAPITTPVSLGTNNNFVIDGTTNRISLKLNAANGMVTGTFLHPASSSINSFQGIILQDQNTVRGFFIGTDQGGTLNIGQ